MEQIFVSYRVGDVDEEAGTIKELVDARFGAGSAYQFTRSNEVGEDFVNRLRLAISRAHVVLAIIGPRWETLHRDPDWVMAELRDAVAAGVPIVPILVGRPSPPEEIPDNQLKRVFERLHFVDSATLISPEGTAQFTSLLKNRYNVVEKNDVPSSFKGRAARALRVASRLGKPRELLLYGSGCAVQKMLQSFALLIAASVASTLMISTADPFATGALPNLILALALKHLSVAIILALILAVPKVLGDGPSIAEIIVASFATMTVFILTSLPAILILSASSQTDTGLMLWVSELHRAGSGVDDLSAMLERLPDLVDDFKEKALVFASIVLTGYFLFVFWAWKMGTVLRTMTRAGWSRIYYLFILLAWPVGLQMLLVT